MNSNIILADKLKDVLITRTAIKTLQSERTVEKIVSFQFKDARDAARTVASIEISGFGKFSISQNKVKRRIFKLSNAVRILESRLENDKATEEEIIKCKEKIRTTKESIEFLKTKLDEN